MIRLALLSWERKYLCLLLVIGLTLAAVPLAQRVRLDLGVESLYPTAGLAVTEYEKARATFGTDEVAAIYAEDAQLFTPERLAELNEIHKQLTALPFVTKVESLFTLPDLRDQGGMISTAPVLARLPKTAEQVAKAKERAVTNLLLRGQLVAEDGTALMMILRLSPKYREM